MCVCACRSNPKSKKGGLKGRRRLDDGEYSEYTDDHNMGMEVHDIRSPHSVTTLTGGISPTPPSSGPGISVASTTCSVSDNDNSTENRAFHGGFPRHVLEGVAEGDSTDGSSHEGHSVVGVPPGAYIKKFDVERSITEVTATPLPPTPTPSLVFISRQADHAHHEMSASPPVATPQAAPATPHSFKPPLPPMCSVVPLPTHDLTSLATHRPSSKKKKPLTMPLPLPLSSLLGPYGGEGILGGGPTDKADVVVGVGVGAKAAPERSSSGPVVTRQASFPLEAVARSVTGSSLSTVRPPPLDIPHSASVGSVGGKVVSGYPPHSHSRPSHSSSSTSMPSGDTPVGSGGGSGMGGFYTPGVGPTTPALSASSTTTPLPNFHVSRPDTQTDRRTQRGRGGWGGYHVFVLVLVCLALFSISSHAHRGNSPPKVRKKDR